MAVQERLQKIKTGKREAEHMRQRLESLRIENAKLKELQAATSSELSCMKDRVTICEQEHGRAGGVNVTKEELETLRQQNIEQNASLRKVKDAMQCVTSYSKTQQKEKEQALRRVASLEQEMLEKEKLRREVASLKDEVAALRLISEETQQRQLNEIQSSSCVKEQQQQRQSTGKDNELMLYVL